MNIQSYDAALRIWEINRNLYLSFFDTYSLQQLNKIPESFSNNLIWNIGHVIVAQQALIYKMCDLPGYISDDLFALYKPGTHPTCNTSQPEVDELKELLISLIDKTKQDFADDVFTSFNPRMTGTGFYLSTFSDAVEFNNYHEGLHLGFMMNIRKFV